MTSRPDDPTQSIGFQDEHWIEVVGGRGAAEVGDEATTSSCHFAMSAVARRARPLAPDPRFGPNRGVTRRSRRFSKAHARYLRAGRRCWFLARIASRTGRSDVRASESCNQRASTLSRRFIAITMEVSARSATSVIAQLGASLAHRRRPALEPSTSPLRRRKRSLSHLPALVADPSTSGPIEGRSPERRTKRERVRIVS